MKISLLKKLSLFSFLFFCLIAYWQASMGNYVCFSDCFQYIVLMGKNIFSLDYWQTLIRMYRPFTVPMLYSFFGDFTAVHQQQIVYFQTGFAFIAWVTFAYSLASTIKNKVFKTIVFAVILLSMFGRSIYIYNMQLLSDSIALSLLLLWYSFIIHLPKIKKSALIFAFFTLFTLIVTCTRDTHIFMIIFAVPLLLKMPLHRHEKILFITLILYLSIACQLNATYRHRTNMLNIITGVVLPDQEKRDFFIQRGMPINEKLFRDPEVIKQWDFSTLHFAPIHHANKKVEKVMHGFLNQAQSVYTRYLLSHPSYIIKNLQNYHQQIFNQSYTEQTGHFILTKLSLMDDIPLDGLALLGFMALLVHCVLPRTVQQEKDFLFYAAIFMVAGFTNTVIAFHGDFWSLAEMKRHTLIGSLFFKMGCVSLLLGTLGETGLFLFAKTPGATKQNC